MDRAYITANKNTVPFDTNPPVNPSGIRLGSPAVTTRGFGEQEMREVGRLISKIIHELKSDDALHEVRRGVAALTERDPLYSLPNLMAR
jgi:glycine hydroxymethyltransferase